MLELVIYNVLFLGIPAALFVLFGVSLGSYVSARRKNKAVAGTFSDSEMKKRIVLLIVFSVIVGVLVAIVFGFWVLLTMAIANM